MDLLSRRALLQGLVGAVVGLPFALRKAPELPKEPLPVYVDPARGLSPAPRVGGKGLVGFATGTVDEDGFVWVTLNMEGVKNG